MRVDIEHLSGAKRALLERRLRGQTKGTRHSRAATPGGEPGPIPLSVVQEDLWYFSQLAPDNPVYNELITVRKTGAFNRDAFKRAFNELVRRHEAWRTTFLMMDGQPVQVVQPPPLFEFPVTDLSDSPRRDAEEHATAIAAELARQPYQLDKGPLLRPMLVRFGEDEHRLYLVLPHLTVDAVSLHRVVLPELVALYDSFAAEEQPALPDPPTQYADYARWSQEWTKSETYARRMEYWRRHLEGAPQLQLPLDHPRPRQQRFRGGMERVRLAEALVRRLRSLGLDERATLFQVLASAFAVLLHRYTAAQDDVVFGIVSDLRQRTEFEAVVGYCFNSVVVRADLGGDPSFRQLVGRLRTELLDGLAQQVPFGRLVGDLQPARDASINPFFQAVLVLLPPPSSTDSEWTLYQDAKLGNAVGTAKLDLTMELDARPEGHIDGRLIYNTDLFEPATARRIIRHWLRLLEGIVEAPERSVSELPLLTEAELQRHVVEWNATAAAYPDGCGVYELVANQVRRTPDAEAVTDGRTSLTFAELDDQAGRLAHRLSELGVGPDVLVGICMERSIDQVVALLAVLRAGGAFVPLEPDQPRERLAHMLADAAPLAVLTATAVEASLPATSATVIRLDAERGAWMAHPPLESPASDPSSLAYVLFTSGSTGAPKGVMVEHRSLVNQLTWRVESFGLTADDRVLQKTPLGFDVSIWEFLCPLICGATLVILEPGAHRDPLRLALAIRTHRISAMQFVPSLLQASLEAMVEAGCDSVRFMASGGEALSPALARRFFECFGPEVELRNVYGPTEATLDAMSWRCDPAGEEIIPIGHPCANTQVYVVDSHLRPVPIGVPGELCVGGVQVARGYLNRPELTADRFVDNPFRPGERMYRTGDVARHKADSSVEFLGRTDSQVKIRGIRIELGEIEAALAAHQDVAAAAVLPRVDERVGGERRLVAYVVPAGGRQLGLGELRAHLGVRLPDAMMPSAFVLLEKLPLTRNGKLDRRALPAPRAQLRAEAVYVAPRTIDEEKLVTIWSEVLRVDTVGVEDNFFELGGDSLLSIHVMALANREGLRLSPVDIFEHQTVAGLAAKAASVRQQDLEDTGADTGRMPSENGRGSPEGFPLAGIDQETLDRLLG
ncbi:MAG: amino acid adenylation domain-containing protein [Candidatus Dormibacter sp.]